MMIVTSEWNVPRYTKLEFKLWQWPSTTPVAQATLDSNFDKTKDAVDQLFAKWTTEYGPFYQISHTVGFTLLSLTPVPPPPAAVATEANHETNT